MQLEVDALHPTSLGSLANETLTQVAEYVVEDNRTFMGLMTTCRRLSGVCEYVRYTSLTVQGSRGRRLLATLISGSSTAFRYALRVKRIWFRYWHDAEMFLVSTLMCEALPLMNNLISLRIDAHTIDVVHTTGRMNRMGLVRDGSHPAQVMEQMAQALQPFSPLTLPRIQNIMISGSYALAAVAHHRPLTELTLESFMDYDELADFVANAENTLLGNSLTVLSIKLVRSIDLGSVFQVVSTAFPRLQMLAMEQSALDFLCAIEFLGSHAAPLRNLHYLALNRRLTYPLMKWGSSLSDGTSFTDKVTARLKVDEFRHEKLLGIGIGHFLWVRTGEGNFAEQSGCNASRWWESKFGTQFSSCRYPLPQ